MDLTPEQQRAQRLNRAWLMVLAGLALIYATQPLGGYVRNSSDLVQAAVAALVLPGSVLLVLGIYRLVKAWRAG